MGRKGQVTVFIIVAVLVVAAIALYFVLSDGSSTEKNLSPEAEKVNSYVESCLRSSASDSISEVASRGGYYEVPENKVDFYSSEPEGIPRYWVVGEPEKSILPSKEILEKEISKSIDENFDECIKGFENLSDQYSVSSGDKEVTTELKEGIIEVSLNYPLTIKYGDRTFSIDNFKVNVETKLHAAYSASKGIVEKQKQEELAQLGFVSSLAYENDFNFDTFRLGDDMIYFLYFDEGDEDLIYAFSIKYNWEVENA